MPSTEGFGKGNAESSYIAERRGVPLLESFYFRFEKPESGEPVDNDLQYIMVMPGGNKEDLTPNADLPLDVVNDGEIWLRYADADTDDEEDNYFYKVSHYIHNARRFQVRDVGCTGKCEQVLNIPVAKPIFRERVFVLVGFKLFFTGDRDHRIDELAVYEEDGKLIVKLNDENDDDVFAYEVDFAMVDRNDIFQMGEVSGRTWGGEQKPMPQGPKLIRGFEFNYKDEPNGDTPDYKLREIGVLMNSNNLEVYFGDKDETPYEYRVKWALTGERVNLP